MRGEIDTKTFVVMLIIIVSFLLLMFFAKPLVFSDSGAGKGGERALDNFIGGIANDVTTGKVVADKDPGG